MGATGTVDPQGRVVFPRCWRRPGDEKAEFVLAAGLSRSIALFPADSFDAMLMRVMERAPQTEQAQNWLSIYMQMSQRVQLDGHGRFPIPGELLHYAGIERKGECEFVSGVGIGRLFAPGRWRRIRLGNHPEPELTPQQEDALSDDELESLTVKRAIDFISQLSSERTAP